MLGLFRAIAVGAVCPAAESATGGANAAPLSAELGGQK